MMHTVRINIKNYPVAENVSEKYSEILKENGFQVLAIYSSYITFLTNLDDIDYKNMLSSDLWEYFDGASILHSGPEKGIEIKEWLKNLNVNLKYFKLKFEVQYESSPYNETYYCLCVRYKEDKSIYIEDISLFEGEEFLNTEIYSKRIKKVEEDIRKLEYALDTWHNTIKSPLKDFEKWEINFPLNKPHLVEFSTRLGFFKITLKYTEKETWRVLCEIDAGESTLQNYKYFIREEIKSLLYLRKESRIKDINNWKSVVEKNRDLFLLELKTLREELEKI